MTVTKVHFINHSSLLINHGDSYIWTDPLFSSTAFETMLSSPPMSVHPAYLLALSKSSADFYILISHGHDDHIDDRLLKLFAHCKIVTTKFQSPSVVNRLKRAGFVDVIEIDTTPTQCGVFELSGFINSSYSLDDSLQLINAPDLSVIHANDCWWPLPDNHLATLKERLRPTSLLASQIGVADSFPGGYNCFTDEEKTQLQSARTRTQIVSGAKNFINLDATYFLHYAAHLKTFSTNVRANEMSGFVSREFVNQTLAQEQLSVNLLDMLPGDYFEHGQVVQGIGRKHYTEDGIKQASVNFWNEYGELRYRDLELEFTVAQRNQLMDIFIDKFLAYVPQAAEAKQFRMEILESNFEFAIDSYQRSVSFDNFAEPNRVDLAVIWEPRIADLILGGVINFEASYIGGLGTFSSNPALKNNGHAVRWLSMFGYVWQKHLATKYVQQVCQTK
jgi:hypothetical protein